MEDYFFPFKLHSAWHVQPSAPSVGQVLLGRALQGHTSAPSPSPIHPVCSSSWQWYMPAEHLLLCAGACVGLCVYTSVCVEAVQVRAFGLEDVKSTLVKCITPFITDVLQQCALTSDHLLALLTIINSLCATQVAENIFQDVFGDFFFSNTSNHFSHFPPINPREVATESI